MRLSTLQFTGELVPSFSTQCCQCAIDILAGAQIKVKRFWQCIFCLWQKSLGNLISQSGRQCSEPTITNSRVSVWDSLGMSC